MGNCWTKYSCRNQDHSHIPNIDSRNVHLITATEKWEATLSEASRDGKLVIANFTTSWCIPCRSIIPAYCELADKYPSFIFLAIDVDELAELSTSWDIQATPTFVFFKDGRQVDILVGDNKSELQKKLAAMDDLLMRSQS